MAYRGDDAGDALEAPTAEGILEVTLGPNRTDLAVAARSLHISDRVATLVDHRKQKAERRGSVKIAGNLVLARGFPREDVGIWIERAFEPKRRRRGRADAAGPADDANDTDAADDDDTHHGGPAHATSQPGGPAHATSQRGGPEHATSHRSGRGRDAPAGMQRIFGVEPVSLLERGGLGALARLDALASRLRAHLAELAGPVRRAVEIGSGHALDKVLLADHGDRYVFYARRLFRDRARFAMAVHGDGRIVVPDGKRTVEVHVTSRFGVRVRGDYIRFADRHGTDIAKVSLPWIGPEDRDEVARRIGAFIDRG